MPNKSSEKSIQNFFKQLAIKNKFKSINKTKNNVKQYNTIMDLLSKDYIDFLKEGHKNQIFAIIGNMKSNNIKEELLIKLLNKREFFQEGNIDKIINIIKTTKLSDPELINSIFNNKNFNNEKNSNKLYDVFSNIKDEQTKVNILLSLIQKNNLNNSLGNKILKKSREFSDDSSKFQMVSELSNYDYYNLGNRNYKNLILDTIKNIKNPNYRILAISRICPKILNSNLHNNQNLQDNKEIFNMIDNVNNINLSYKDISESLHNLVSNIAYLKSQEYNKKVANMVYRLIKNENNKKLPNEYLCEIVDNIQYIKDKECKNLIFEMVDKQLKNSTVDEKVKIMQTITHNIDHLDDRYKDAVIKTAAQLNEPKKVLVNNKYSTYSYDKLLDGRPIELALSMITNNIEHFKDKIPEIVNIIDKKFKDKQDKMKYLNRILKSNIELDNETYNIVCKNIFNSKNSNEVKIGGIVALDNIDYFIKRDKDFLNNHDYLKSIVDAALAIKKENHNNGIIKHGDNSYSSFDNKKFFSDFSKNVDKFANIINNDYNDSERRIIKTIINKNKARSLFCIE